MNLRHDNLKVVVALLLTGSIAVGGLTECGSTRLCTNVAGATSSCAVSERCCCRRSGETGTCCCAAESPPSPITASKQSDQGLKWLSWAKPALALTSLISTGLEAPQHGGQLLAPVRRSVQLLLCTWRL
jgi:hypothetical protein